MLKIKARDLERFHASITKQENGCWICSRAPSGIYSRVRFNGKRIMGHVLALMIKLGRPLRKGYKSCHECNTPRCVNPAHLREDTQSGNVNQMVAQGRHGVRRGDANPCTIIKDEDVLYIRTSLDNGTETLSSLAAKLRVTFQAVYRVAKGVRAQEVGGPLLTKKTWRFLTPFEVIQVRSLTSAGVPQVLIARSLGIHQATVSNIVHGSKRRDVPFLLPT